MLVGFSCYRENESHIVRKNMSSNENQRNEDDDDEDESVRRRPSVQETYASKLHAAKLHIAANAAYEAIQRVEAQRAAEAAAAKKDDDDDDDDDDVMIDISSELSSAKFFRGSISELSNTSTSEALHEDNAAGSPKRKSIIEGDGKNFIDASPPELKRSRSEPRDLQPKNAACQSPTTGGKGAVLGLIRARSESLRTLRSLREEDDESIRLHEEIHELAKQNRELWSTVDVGRMQKGGKPKHHTYINVVHETIVSEEEEDQDEAELGLICFQAKYNTAVITVAEGKPVAVCIDKKRSKAITSMMAGLARSIPNQFTDWIHIKEATSDGFILAYRISPTIYRLCGEEERVQILRDFKKHLNSIGTSLNETHGWLKKADAWNKYLDEETENFSHPDCNSGLHDGKIEYLMTREEAEALEKKLKINAPSEIEKVVTREYEIL